MTHNSGHWLHHLLVFLLEGKTTTEGMDMTNVLDELFLFRGAGKQRVLEQTLTFLPESLCPHSPLSYHHLFFNLSKMACSLSFSTARFTGILHRRRGEGIGNNINNIMHLHVILCYCWAAAAAVLAEVALAVEMTSTTTPDRKQCVKVICFNTPSSSVA